MALNGPWTTFGAIVGPLLALGLVILVGARNAMLFSVILGITGPSMAGIPGL